MDPDSLRIFCAVASEASVTQAAARLGRAPSNVTTRVQQLEAELGADLFVRTSKRMTLSAAGERFLDYAQRLLALGDEARQMVTGDVDGGALRIGSMESTAASRLPALLGAYHAGHPDTQLELVTGPSRWLLEQVRTGRLDCAFLALEAPLDDVAALDAAGLAARPVWQEHLRLLMPASQSKARHPADVTVSSLAAFPVGCTYRAMAEVLLGVAGAPRWRVQEMASYHAMIACVAAGSCVTVLPESVLRLSGGHADLPSLPAGQVATQLVWRQGYDVPAFRRLLQALPDIASAEIASPEIASPEVT